MTVDVPIFSPEVEELLREVAAEPDSVLLRMPREKVRGSLLEDRSPLGPMTAGLSSAEHELVRVHRDEFAFQLRRAAWIKLAEDGAGPMVVSRQWQENQRIPVPSEIEVRAGLRSSAHGSALLKAPECSVPDWIDSPMVEWPSVSSIAAVAHRLAPKSQDLIYAGSDCLIRKSPDTALEYFAASLRNESEPELATAIIANIANCHDQLGELHTSTSEWKLAHHQAPHRPDYLACWFLLSMKTGEDWDIEAADRELRSYDEYPLQFEALAARVRARRRIGLWVPPNTLSSSLSRWRMRLSSGGTALAKSLS